MKTKVSLIVTDLDNTLYDWVDMWYKSFEAMIEILVAQSGLSRGLLESEIQAIFQKYGTSEYGYVIEEIPSLTSKHPSEDLTIVYQDAIEAYRAARKSLTLYPGVKETLEQFKRLGCLIVAYTDSMSVYTVRRLKALGLDNLLDYVYSPPDPSVPLGSNRRNKTEQLELHHTVQRYVPSEELKPNPQILRKIINDTGIETDPRKTIYVGDSLMKDVKMAQDAGVTDVYAKYGLAANTDAYEVLRRVTHWTKKDVEREKAILTGGLVTPKYVLEHTFSELLNIFDFVPHSVHGGD